MRIDSSTQENVSFRHTALQVNQVARFNAKVIHETKVGQALKDLLKRSFTLRYNRSCHAGFESDRPAQDRIFLTILKHTCLNLMAA